MYAESRRSLIGKLIFQVKMDQISTCVSEAVATKAFDAIWEMYNSWWSYAVLPQGHICCFTK